MRPNLHESGIVGYVCLIFNSLDLSSLEIEVESQLGRGSCFNVKLTVPIVQAQPHLLVPLKKQPITGYVGEEQKKVLIVDDIRSNRAVLVDLLRPLGFGIAEAENGEEGIQIAHIFQPDLILMDLVMPLLTGLEATQQLRQPTT